MTAEDVGAPGSRYDGILTTRGALSMQRVTVRRPGDMGIFINSGRNRQDVDLSEIVIEDTPDDALFINRITARLVVDDVTIRNSADRCVTLLRTNRGVLSNLDIDGCGSRGLRVQLSNRNDIFTSAVRNARWGVELTGNARDNRVHDNFIEDNTGYGLRVTNSGTNTRNLVFENCFTNPVAGTRNGRDDETAGPPNTWFDNGASRGNYWGSENGATGFSQTCMDIDTNGICDSAFAIPGAAGSSDDFPLTACPLAPLLAYYQMEESSWNGTAGEVLDASGNANNATSGGGADTAGATPAIAGDPGTCGYADVPDNVFSVAPPAGIATGLDVDSVIGGEQTISFWFNAASTWNELIWRPLFDATPSGTFNWFMLARRANRLLFLVNTQSGFGLVFTPLLGLNAGEWHHFATTVDTVNLRVQIFVDGVLVGSGALPNANLANFQSLFVGDGVSGNAFLSSSANGLFDELRIYRKVLQPLEIQADMNATHPCPILLDEFDIDHDGFGIHCVAEPIAVTAEDISNNPVVNYDRTVTLDTGSGRGDWSINTGNGVLVDATPDDGIAMYTYDNIDGDDGDPSDYGTATFDLSFVDGPSPVNIAVTEAGFTDDDLEGPLRFSPVGFLLDPVPNQVAGTDFLLSLTAYGQLPPAPSCGPILSYAGPKDVGFWANYYDPGVGITNATVDANPIAMSEAAAATQSVTFAAGQATLTTKYKDAGQIGINAKDDQFTDPSLPSGISGATNPFVVIPADFEFTDIQRTSDGFPNQAAADASGLSFMAAGDAFTVRMTALDAEGDATPNFGQESVAEEILLAQALLAPVTGNNPPLLPGNRIAAFSGGQGTRTDLHWDEVGIIAFTPSIGDGDYLGAGDVMGTGSGSVGRFVPDRFDVNVSVGGDFADACSGFTYMDQTFYYQSAPALRFVALNSGGATTLNYGDSGNPGERFWKLNTPFAARGYINQAASGSAMFSAVNAGGVLVIGDADLDGEGIIALEASAAGDRFLYQRQAVEAPFQTSVDLDLTVADLSDDDGVCALTPTTTEPAKA